MDNPMNKQTRYPEMPPVMNSSIGTAAAGGSASEMPLPPPSYEQATGTATNASSGYPAVQVLPTPNVADLNRPTVQAAQAAAPMAHTTYTNQYVPGPVQTQATYAYSSSTTQYLPPPCTIPTTTRRTYTTTTQAAAPPLVFIQQPVLLALGPEPTYITCPNCNVQKLTRIEYEPSVRTHLMAALLCFLGLWCCVCLPYCAGSCMNTNHYCGNCNKFLGSYGTAI